MTASSPTIAAQGSIDGIEYEIHDFTKLVDPGFLPGFYYSVGDLEGELTMNEAAISLEGPYATVEAAIDAATDFIHFANLSADDA